MESDQDPSLFSSLQHLLEELEHFITLESRRSHNPWVSVDKLNELFFEKYGVSLEEVAKVQGHSDSLRNLFTSSSHFSIYVTNMPKEFYIALFQSVVPGFHQPQASPIKYRIKRPWKVDGRLLRMLKTEGYEEILSQRTQRTLKEQPPLVHEIKSINDLEIALTEMIKSSTANNLNHFVTIAGLSHKFFNYYGQSIRTVMRSVCPDMKLIDLLQTMPNLHVQEVNNDWQIIMKTDL